MTYDEDFYEWQLVRNDPPKIIWLRFGNAKNSVILEKILDNIDSIKKLEIDPELAVLEIH